MRWSWPGQVWRQYQTEVSVFVCAFCSASGLPLSPVLSAVKAFCLHCSLSFTRGNDVNTSKTRSKAAGSGHFVVLTSPVWEITTNATGPYPGGGGSGGSEEPSCQATKVCSTEGKRFLTFCVLFVSEPCCNHSVFTARMHKFVEFGSIFPNVFSGWACPQTPPPPHSSSKKQQEPTRLNSPAYGVGQHLSPTMYKSSSKSTCSPATCCLSNDVPVWVAPAFIKLLKQYVAGECVDLLDDYDFAARTISEKGTHLLELRKVLSQVELPLEKLTVNGKWKDKKNLEKRTSTRFGGHLLTRSDLSSTWKINLN